MATWLLVLMVMQGVGTPPAPGTELPDRDALVRQFRAQLERHARPLDNFVRRERATDHNSERFSNESTVQVNGSYYKLATRELQSGVERVDVLTPMEFFHLIRIPGEEWKVSAHTPLDGENRAFLQRRLQGYSVAREYSQLGLYSLGRLLEGPGWTVTKVTAERAGEATVHRFHFHYLSWSTGYRTRQAGYFDVEPTTGVIVYARVGDTAELKSGTDTELTFAGTVHGVPALQRVRKMRWVLAADGTIQSTPQSTMEVLQFEERSEVATSEYGLGHYGLGPPYRAIAGVAAGVLLLIGWGYALVAWRRGRRRRAMTWAVAGE